MGFLHEGDINKEQRQNRGQGRIEVGLQGLSAQSIDPVEVTSISVVQTNNKTKTFPHNFMWIMFPRLTAQSPNCYMCGPIKFPQQFPFILFIAVGDRGGPCRGVSLMAVSLST